RRTPVASLDRDRYLGAFLQLLRVDSVGQRFAVGAEDLDVLGNFEHSILAVGMYVQDALLGIDFLDGRRDVEGQRAADAEHECERRGEKGTPHGTPPSVEKSSENWEGRGRGYGLWRRREDCRDGRQDEPPGLSRRLARR